MNHSAILRDGASPGRRAGAVSLLRLLDLYGEVHRAELDELWAAPGTDYLALFADDAGRDCAILPVGPAHEYRNLDTVLGLRIEGLRAVCFTPAREASQGAGAPAVPADSDIAAYRDEFPEAARGLAEALAAGAQADPVRVVMRHLVSRLHEIARREAELVTREHYVHEAEERLNARAEAHIVRHAELEQREHEIDSARRNLDRRAGGSPSPFEFAPSFARDTANFTVRTF